MDWPLYIAAPRREPQPRGPAEWGKWMPLLCRSISDVYEDEAIDHVLNDALDRDLILNIKGIDSAGATLRNVPLRKSRGQSTGDVDILVIPPGAAEQSTAIQVKRFPVKVDEKGRLADRRETRFEELFNRGAEQANYVARLGFFQVYLWVFVLIDTRAANDGRYTYNGASSALHARIDYAISLRLLDPRVGLMKFEWVQPMDRPPFDLSAGGGHLVHLATSATQPAELTHWIRTKAASSRSSAGRSQLPLVRSIIRP